MANETIITSKLTISARTVQGWVGDAEDFLKLHEN